MGERALTLGQVEAIKEALVRFDGGAQMAAAYQASAELIGGSNPSMDATRRRNEAWASALRELLAGAQFDPRAHPASCAFHVDQYPHECTCGLIQPKDSRHAR